MDILLYHLYYQICQMLSSTFYRSERRPREMSDVLRSQLMLLWPKKKKIPLDFQRSSIESHCRVRISSRSCDSRSKTLWKTNANKLLGEKIKNKIEKKVIISKKKCTREKNKNQLANYYTNVARA